MLIVPVRGDDGLEGVITRGAAELIDAYGLLAVFAAGLGFRRYEFEHQYNERVHQGAQVVQNFAELAVILLLGSLVTSDLLSDPGLSGWLLVPLLLCLIGRLPYSSPPRLQARRWTAASGRWSPWFGAKGVASVYFLALLIEGGTITGGEADTVIWTAVAVAIVSILVHGATADPLSRRLLDEDRQA